DPDVFDPERFSPENEAKIPRYAYMPFGGGNRVCIGNSFAMMENKIILAVFVQQFSFSLCEQTKIEPEPQITLSNKSGMKLRVCRR
ncbi:cytochrome P450, partial [Oleiphilus sp. HI0125]